MWRAEVASAPLPQGYFTRPSRLIALLSLVSLALIFVVLYTRSSR